MQRPADSHPRIDRRTFTKTALIAPCLLASARLLAAKLDLPGGITLIADDLEFPEGLFTYADGALGCVEIDGGTLLRIEEGRKTVISRTGPGPNGAMRAPNGKIVVADNGGLTFERRNGIYRITGIPNEDVTGSIMEVDPTSGAASVLFDHCGGVPLNGPNDLVYDGDEGFWFTDTGKIRAYKRDVGALFWARLDGSRIERVLSPLDSPNGLVIDGSGRWLYIALSASRRILRARIDGPAALSQVEALPPISGKFLLDNIVIDVGGDIISGCVLMGGLMVIAPTGAAKAFLPLPDYAVTAVAFGGPDRRTLYAALSTTGRIVSLPWPRPGIDRAACYSSHCNFRAGECAAQYPSR